MPADGLFQVDKANDWIDYTTLALGFISAIGTVGALLVAAYVYKRQSDEARLQQASLVFLRVSRRFTSKTGSLADADPASNMYDCRDLNSSDNNIYYVQLMLLLEDELAEGGGIPQYWMMVEELPAGGVLEHTFAAPEYPLVAKVKFSDAVGRRWERYLEDLVEIHEPQRRWGKGRSTGS